MFSSNDVTIVSGSEKNLPEKGENSGVPAFYFMSEIHVYSFRTVDETRSLCGQCRSRSDCTKCAG